jgi:hypothetical protein
VMRSACAPAAQYTLCSICSMPPYMPPYNDYKVAPGSVSACGFCTVRKPH